MPDVRGTTSTVNFQTTAQIDAATMEDLNKSTNAKRFPSTFGEESGQWLLFAQYKYTRPDATSPAKGTIINGSTVALPVPNNLGTAYSASWDNRSLGMVGSQLGKIVSSGIDAAKAQKNGGSAIDSLKASLGDRNWVTTAADMGKAFVLDNVFQNEYVQNGASYKGLARNPFQAFVYTGPQFRNFSFAWKLVPSSIAEANTIRDIIMQFKIGQAPSFDATFKNNIFDYPNIFQIQIANADYLFKISQCVLTGMSVQYHGEGQPAYFSDGTGKKVPFSIQLELSFQEIQILLQDDIKAGY